MTRLLDRRVALITGGTRGLGRAIAQRFAKEGCRGALIDLTAVQAEGDPPAGFSVITGDVSEEDSFATAVGETLKTFGKLDIVIANAGLVPPWRETETLDMAEWDRVMAVNVRGIAL